MDSETKTFVVGLVSSLSERLTGIQNEIRTGLTGVHERLDQTNAKLDQTNVKLDQTVELLDQTTVRVDKTNIRLDAAIKMTRDFRKDVSKRLDAIGQYILSHDAKLLLNEHRIKSLEDRMDELDDTG